MRMSRALLLGRFQPLHLGHVKVMEEVLSEFDGVIVALGSAQESHTPTNPFSAGERFSMVEMTASDAGMDKVTPVPVADLNRYGLYIGYLRTMLPPFDAMVAHNSLTLRLCEESDVEVYQPQIHDRDVYSGTEIRRRIIANESWQDLVPDAVVKVLEEIDGAQRLRTIASGDSRS